MEDPARSGAACRGDTTQRIATSHILELMVDAHYKLSSDPFEMVVGRATSILVDLDNLLLSGLPTQALLLRWHICQAAWVAQVWASPIGASGRQAHLASFVQPS